MNEIEVRNAQVADVSYPKRTVTVLVMPYETPAEITTRSGRHFTEIVSKGAYDGVQRRNNIRANRDHDWSKLAGKVTALYPDRDEGLVADVRMFKTPLGEETLELCAEDGLAASAGFGLMREGGNSGPVKADAEQWTNNRTVRRLNSVWLDHVAFVPDPAHETQVLDVRRVDQQAEMLVVATPNLDRLQHDRWRAELEALNARWGV
jgi:phage head maturation protease